MGRRGYKASNDSVLLYKAQNEEPFDEVNNPNQRRHVSTYSNPIPEGHDGEIQQ